jgi:hypothetical protein
MFCIRHCTSLVQLSRSIITSLRYATLQRPLYVDLGYDLGALVMVAAVSYLDDFDSQDSPLWTPIFVVFVGDGVDITLHVRRRHLQDPGMGRIYPLPTKYDIILQPPNNMAKGPSLPPTLVPCPPAFPFLSFPVPISLLVP